MLNFSQALMEAKRRARLSGRPLSQQESSGIAEGYAAQASDRLAKAKQLSLQEGQFNETMAYNRERDELNREAEEKAGMVGSAVNLGTTAATLYTLKGLAGKKAAPIVGKTAGAVAGNQWAAPAAGPEWAAPAAGPGGAIQPAATGAVAPGATTGSVVSGIGSGVATAAPYYALAKAGGAIGREQFPKGTPGHKISESLERPLNVEQYWAKQAWGDVPAVERALDLLNPLAPLERWVSDSLGSYLCTATTKHSGLDKESVQLLNTFKKYAGKHHKGVLEFYLRVGPRIVAAIEEAEGEDTKQFYNDLKASMIKPVIDFTKEGELELAYQLYKKTTLDLVSLFIPELFEEFSTVIKIDEGLKEAA